MERNKRAAGRYVLDDTELFIQNELARFRQSLDAKENDHPLTVQKLLKYIHQNIFDRTLSINEMKRNCKCANNNVVSVFRKSVGHGPCEYIRNNKLIAASLILRKRYVEIFLLAQSIHYTQEAFTRIFKNYFGCTPVQYCDKYRKGNPSRESGKTDYQEK